MNILKTVWFTVPIIISISENTTPQSIFRIWKLALAGTRLCLPEYFVMAHRALPLLI